MKRPAVALLALLAVLALASAAATFDAARQPSVSGGVEPTEKTPDVPANPSGAGQGSGTDDSSEEIGRQVDTPRGTESSDDDESGLPPLFVAAFVGGLVASAALVVILTGDDRQAPDPPEGGRDDDPPPTPTVDPEYDSPGDGALFDAWGTVATRANADDSATPSETAREAVLRGLPDDAVEDVRRAFRAVRYGRDAPEDHRRTASEALERMEGGDRGDRP